MAHVIAVAGKGGVGKSVFTAGLGYALAGRGRRVLLVDCDAGLRSRTRARLHRPYGYRAGLLRRKCKASDHRAL